MIIKKIEELGYKIVKEGDKTYKIIAPNGVAKMIPIDDKPIYVGVGSNCKTVDDAENAIASGKGLKTTGNEIYKEIFSEPEEYCQWQNNFSLKTLKYLEEQEEKIGLISFEVKEYGEFKTTFNENEFVKVMMPPQIQTSSVKLYKHNDKYICVYVIQPDIDSFYEHRITFKNEPSLQNLKTALLIDEVKTDFDRGKIKETFRCWECGRTVNWLDIDGDLKQKYYYALDKYCGC